jgi:hypothetical protein
MLNSKTHTIMAQLTISFGIDFESRSNNNQSFVKVAHRSSITANEESDFGDIYEEYEDFQYTSQVWH